MIKFTTDLVVIVPETAPDSHRTALIALNKPDEIGYSPRTPSINTSTGAKVIAILFSGRVNRIN